MRSASTARALRLTAGAATVAGLAWAVGAGPASAAPRAEPGADLVFGQTAAVDGVSPGEVRDLSFTVQNKGDGPATRVALFLTASQGLSLTQKFSNCTYEAAPAEDEGPARTNATCDIEQTLEPGVVYVPERPLGLKVLDRALYERLTLNVQADSIAFPDGTQHGGGADPVLRLVPQKTPADPPAALGSGQLDVDITARNTADFALTGSKVTGKKGQSVDATVTFANKGPAWVRNDVYGPIGVFDVAIPAGTSVSKAPEFCLASGAASFRCTTPYNYVDEDSERAYVFRLRVDKVVPNAAGKVSFVKGDHRWGTLPFDTDPSNNTARLVVNASAGDGGTGGGSTTGGTSGSGSTGGSTSGSTTGGTSGGTSGSSGTSGTTGGTTGTTGGTTGATTGTTGGDTQLGGALADTGTDTTLLAGGSAAALLTAGGLILTARRRTGRRAAR